ncbi:T9SS type A sorting domain-containing protein, partial [Taibaiella soli]
SCNATSTATTITVNPAPTATITAATATTFCTGGSVVLNANTGTGLTYQWKNGANDITGATGASYTATAAGSYSVVVSNTSCNATSTATTVTVNPLPTATITANGMALSVGTFSSYQWYMNNQTITGATTQTYTATQNGSYYVAVTNNGCTNNSDTVTFSSTGMENVNSKNGVTVYPNPAQDVVSINAPVAVNVTIRNINGQVVFAENNVRRADISKLASGLYMIFVTDEKGQLLLTEKLMKK